MWNELMQYLQFPFVRYALITGILISFTASILGVTLVLKRFAHIGDGLSHVAFGAMAAASVLKMTNQKMLVILPVTVLTAVLLLKQGRSSGNGGDAGIAMISVASLAAGYLMMNIFKTSSNVSADVCTTLFGSTSILTLTKAEVWLCVILSAAVLAIYVVMYHRIFSVTFDEEFARATGVDTEKINLLIAAASALVIVLAMNLVGSLLISALVVFPAVTAMTMFRSFKSVTICAAVISVICAASGMVFSILKGTPVGSTIVAADAIAWLLFSAVHMITGRHA
ncbi:MAG: metal ABC transporter permease [Erysipelotrichaceae bacterium]|nr:metal ABC transporter permease [Erysipelotrichaceae bacterium]